MASSDNNSNRLVSSDLSLFFVLFCVCLCPLRVHMFPNGYYNYPPQPYGPGRTLDYSFYDITCPNLLTIVHSAVWSAINKDPRMAASLLRLHFHDCIVDGCDASVLLDDTQEMQGEKKAGPNLNSLRGFQVIDAIKADLETSCPSTVSCADILALAAREAVLQAGGPSWPVGLGRRDSVSASMVAANQQIPTPFESLQNITAKFTSKGLDLKDVVVLSGGHTIGFAQCFTFKNRLFNFKESGKPDPDMDSVLLSGLQRRCPNKDSSNRNLAPLDSASFYSFDNAYYSNLVKNSGLLQSDQVLNADPITVNWVNYYSLNQFAFFNDFAASMVKLSSVGVLTGQNGQVRLKCGSVNRG
ncbi:peroxidase 10-like [Neltuma alba]|uniref:peroxidase 10-like n=1 Tax=Neltuma alba TaxID=207710 RepID=UPI0010A3C78B|nr:peroxidase 10-like [Prosopis alba]